ncbi:MAG: signal peptide peptidase SppA [bacterium]|nr:signal peptide peptidase SppA [bacterium]
MARKRDVVIAVVIIGSFAVVSIFFLILMVGMFSGDGDLQFVGLGGSVAVVEMFGVMDEYSGRPVIRQLDRWEDNRSIKAVVIHVESPGGGVSISQELHDAILRIREEKPVVVAMGAVAASGGYYIACAADRVIANPGTLTGSIGTVMSFHTYKDLMEKLGIGMETIKSGELKDVGTYAREMTKREELMLRSVIMDGYEQFVEVVAEGRDMEKEEVYPLADGSIFTGLQAYNLGLVDTLGGLRDAIELAADLAELEGEPNVVRPRRRDQTSIFDLLGGFMGRFERQVQGTEVGPSLMYLYQ